jgi:hypothetical protein
MRQTASQRVSLYSGHDRSASLRAGGPRHYLRLEPAGLFDTDRVITIVAPGSALSARALAAGACMRACCAT